MKTRIIISTGLFLLGFNAIAQVGIGTNTFIPDPSAMLELQLGDPASPRGFLMPRLDPAHETSILGNAPAAGLLYYSNSFSQFKFFDGTSFLAVNPWSVNADYSRLIYNPGISFRVGIGTSDPQATLDVAGDVSVSGTVSGFGTIPLGGIIMWSGDPENLPPGWALCDGQSGTPDLRGRFIVSYDERTGGSLPSFSDGLYNSVNNSGGVKTHGHTAGSNTVGNHNHTLPARTGRINNTDDPDTGNASYKTEDDGEGYDQWNLVVNTTNEEGQHFHNLGGNTGDEGSHSHIITVQDEDGRPPFFVLAFIIRVQ